MTNQWSDTFAAKFITYLYLVDAEEPFQVLTGWVRLLIASIFALDRYRGTRRQEFERAIFSIRILAMFCTPTNYQKRWATLDENTKPVFFFFFRLNLTQR